jgi:hypothetical protein
MALVRAQQELAQVLGLPGGCPLVLPADPPHVGPYATKYEELYAARNLSPRLRLIHRTLPILDQAIEARATAVVAADDALKAVLESYDARKIDLSTVLSYLADAATQRRAMIAIVCDYNHQIGEYAFTAVTQPLPPETLVRVLIQTNDGPGAARTPARNPLGRMPAATVPAVAAAGVLPADWSAPEQPPSERCPGECRLVRSAGAAGTTGPGRTREPPLDPRTGRRRYWAARYRVGGGARRPCRDETGGIAGEPASDRRRRVFHSGDLPERIAGVVCRWRFERHQAGLGRRAAVVRSAPAFAANGQ